VGLRAGWTKGAGAGVEKTAAAAAVATDPTKRKALYQTFQRQLNASGPYFPLMQPTQVFVATSDLKNAVYNAVYSVDVTKLAPS
jgi:peptide/nickel transport system substrate-binding protein